MRNVTAWKVVKRIEDEIGGTMLVSLFAREGAQVEYKPEEWVEAPRWLAEHGLHLTVFEGSEDAYKAMEEVGSSELWQVEVEGAVGLSPWRFSTCEKARENWPEWASSRAHLTGEMYWFYRIESWPAGTMMVKRVKLVERVATSMDGWLMKE